MDSEPIEESQPVKTRRLFFALWPPHATRVSIERVTAISLPRSGGRPIPPENFHITLIFLGNVVEAQLGPLIAAAAAVRGESFQLQFQRIETWPGSRILCLTTEEELPVQMVSLRQQLQSRIAEEMPSHRAAACFPGTLAPEGGAASEGRVVGASASNEHSQQQEHPFRPHVTLARRLKRMSRAVAISPVDWPVCEFVLVESRVTFRGSKYEILSRWPLRAAR